MTKITKGELEYLLSAKAGADRYPGYFKGKQFVRAPFWVAKLGSQAVFLREGKLIADDRGYATRNDALEAAEAFREKLRKMLDDGEYVDAITH